MTLNLYKGDENTCGLATSGGTESIVTAMLAYREQGRIVKGITRPNIVVSSTAHPAFGKGGFYLGIEVRKAQITKNCKADVSAMRSQIDSNTVAIVASCPEFPYGSYDPLPEIAAIA